ncbi:MAG: WbuC family cupin fold metalloprotein [Pseudomonadota bacterium]
MSLTEMTAESPEVYYSNLSIGRVDNEVLNFLKERASETKRGRCRLCLHPTPDAIQQEMVIVMRGDSYVRPHAHVGKGETLLVLDGQATAPIFSEDGAIVDAISLGPTGSGRTFFYRMPEQVYHGLWISTDWLVYVETTIGPFSRDATLFPDWGPDLDDPQEIAKVRREQLAMAERLV